MGLTNALSTPAREQYLVTACRRFSSSVRNAFRQDVSADSSTFALDLILVVADT